MLNIKSKPFEDLGVIFSRVSDNLKLGELCED